MKKIIIFILTLLVTTDLVFSQDGDCTKILALAIETVYDTKDSGYYDSSSYFKMDYEDYKEIKRKSRTDRKRNGFFSATFKKLTGSLGFTSDKDVSEEEFNKAVKKLNLEAKQMGIESWSRSNYTKFLPESLATITADAFLECRNGDIELAKYRMKLEHEIKTLDYELERLRINAKRRGLTYEIVPLGNDGLKGFTIILRYNKTDPQSTRNSVTLTRISTKGVTYDKDLVYNGLEFSIEESLDFYRDGNADFMRVTIKNDLETTIIHELDLSDLFPKKKIIEYDGGFYDGTVFKGVPNGHGRFEKDGTVLVGNFKDGLLHDKNGKYYVGGTLVESGEFKNGELDGMGKRLEYNHLNNKYSSKDYYEGEFKRGYLVKGSYFAYNTLHKTGVWKPDRIEWGHKWSCLKNGKMYDFDGTVRDGNYNECD